MDDLFWHLVGANKSIDGYEAEIPASLLVHGPGSLSSQSFLPFRLLLPADGRTVCVRGTGFLPLGNTTIVLRWSPTVET